MPIYTRGQGAQWTVELQNHGGGGEGLVVELVGPAFTKSALEVLQGEAFFPASKRIHTARRSKLKTGYRFTFDELPLVPPTPTARRKRKRQPITIEATIERAVRAALGAGPFLRFTVKALSTPSRTRPLAFSLVTKPEGALDGGFTLSAWFGHPELMFTEFF